MTCTFIAAMAIGALAPADEPKLDKFNGVFHDPVIAPYSELILFHASIETQQTTHSLWLLDAEGKARRIAKETIDPECLGVLPNDPVAIVADHKEPGERYLLTSLRTGEVVESVPKFDLSVRRALTDQLNRNMLLVASDEEGALGLYTFQIEAWYKAKVEERAAIKPRKVWSLTSDPVDLVFSRDGGRIAVLKGNDLQIITIGDDVTAKTYVFPGNVVYPRDFHPSLNVLMYESMTAMYGMGQEFGEVGVLDLGTGKRRTAFYFAEELAPNKRPKFDASGSFMFVDTWGDDTFRHGKGTSSTGQGSIISQKPRPIAFPINLARENVSLVLHSRTIFGVFPETLRPIMVTSRTDRAFLDVVQRLTETCPAFKLNEHSGWSSGMFDREVHRETRNGRVDCSVNWRFTTAYSPTKPGIYVEVATAAVLGTTGTVNTDWNVGSIERYDASLPPAYQRLGRDGLYRDGEIVRKTREVQGDILLDTDVAVFDEPSKNYFGWVLHYPNWSHYGP